MKRGNACCERGRRERSPKCGLTLPSRGLGCEFYDRYRPVRAVRAMAEWAGNADESARARYFPRVDKRRLIEQGYIAMRSAHSTGLALDLTLVDNHQPAASSFRACGAAAAGSLDMGTGFDCFDPLNRPVGGRHRRRSGPAPGIARAPRCSAAASSAIRASGGTLRSPVTEPPSASMFPSGRDRTKKPALYRSTLVTPGQIRSLPSSAGCFSEPVLVLRVANQMSVTSVRPYPARTCRTGPRRRCRNNLSDCGPSRSCTRHRGYFPMRPAPTEDPAP